MADVKKHTDLWKKFWSIVIYSIYFALMALGFWYYSLRPNYELIKIILFGITSLWESHGFYRFV